MRWSLVAGVTSTVVLALIAFAVPVRDSGNYVVAVTEVAGSAPGVCGEVFVGGDIEVERKVPLVDTDTVVALNATLVDPSLEVVATEDCSEDVYALEGWAVLANPSCDEPGLTGPEEDEAGGGFGSGGVGADIGTRCDGEGVVMRVWEEDPDGASAAWSGEYSLGSSGIELIGGDMVWCLHTELAVTQFSASPGISRLDSREVQPEVPVCLAKL